MIRNFPVTVCMYCKQQQGDVDGYGCTFSVPCQRRNFAKCAQNILTLAQYGNIYCIFCSCIHTKSVNTIGAWYLPYSVVSPGVGPTLRQPAAISHQRRRLKQKKSSEAVHEEKSKKNLFEIHQSISLKGSGFLLKSGLYVQVTQKLDQKKRLCFCLGPYITLYFLGFLFQRCRLQR